MNERFRQNKNAGDGIGLERSTNNGKTWEEVGYINTGTGESTARLARTTVSVLNRLPDIMADYCPSLLALECHGECSGECSEEYEQGECERCWDEALDNAE